MWFEIGDAKNLRFSLCVSVVPWTWGFIPFYDVSFQVGTVGADLLIKSDETCRDLVDEAKNYLLLPQERPHMQGPRTRPRKPIRRGEVLFAVGGWCSGDAIASVERHDPQTGVNTVNILNDLFDIGQFDEIFLLICLGMENGCAYDKAPMWCRCCCSQWSSVCRWRTRWYLLPKFYRKVNRLWSAGFPYWLSLTSWYGTFRSRKWFLNTNLFLIRPFLITKFGSI